MESDAWLKAMGMDVLEESSSESGSQSDINNNILELRSASQDESIIDKTINSSDFPTPSLTDQPVEQCSGVTYETINVSVDENIDGACLHITDASSTENTVSNKYEDTRDNAKYTATSADIQDTLNIDTDQSSTVGAMYELAEYECNQKTFECSICERRYSLKASLTRHLKQHSTETFDCDVCGKIYHIKAELKRHQKSHEGPQFQCTTCIKIFIKRLGCKRHEKKTHKGVFSHYCEVCGKGFNYRPQLVNHSTTHSEEKQHVCLKCTKPYKTQSSLSRHMATCGINKQLKCDTCGIMFKSKRYLKEHSLKHKRNVELFQCPTCGKTFGHHSSLYRHKKKSEHF